MTWKELAYWKKGAIIGAFFGLLLGLLAYYLYTGPHTDMSEINKFFLRILFVFTAMVLPILFVLGEVGLDISMPYPGIGVGTFFLILLYSLIGAFMGKLYSSIPRTSKLAKKKKN